MLYYLFRFIVQPLYKLLFMPRIYGRENLKKIRKGKAIIICNHRSLSDPVFLACTTPRFIHFMAKSELFESFIGRVFFKSLLVFPVNRNTADMNSMKEAMSILNEGKVFGIFPEGKRCVTDSMDTFEKGSAFFALKAKAPILPMYIPSNNYKLFKRPRLYVGELIEPEEYNFEGSKSAAVNKLNTMLEQRMHELEKQAEI